MLAAKANSGSSTRRCALHRLFRAAGRTRWSVLRRPPRTTRSARRTNESTWRRDSSESGVRRRNGSSGLVQAVGEGVQRVDRSFVLDDVVDLDPAADGVAVALGGDVDEDGRLGGGRVIGPRQLRGVDPLRLGVDVQV